MIDFAIAAEKLVNERGDIFLIKTEFYIQFVWDFNKNWDKDRKGKSKWEMENII